MPSLVAYTRRLIYEVFMPHLPIFDILSDKRLCFVRGIEWDIAVLGCVERCSGDHQRQALIPRRGSIYLQDSSRQIVTAFLVADFSYPINAGSFKQDMSQFMCIKTTSVIHKPSSMPEHEFPFRYVHFSSFGPIHYPACDNYH